MRASRGNASSTARDLLLAVGVVAALLGGMFVYAGTWPPMVVVESGSMMHVVPSSLTAASEGVPYGRYGTIDPGDIVLVKKVRSREDVTTWARGEVTRYGRAGDVIIYHPFNNSDATPIIHRAMAWVDVVPTRNGPEYRVEWVDDQTLVFNASGIYLPELGFDASRGFSPTNGYRPPYSGFITKGDNPTSNSAADQAATTRDARLADLVQPGWIVGTARAEIPWVGLVKLVFSARVNQANPTWVKVGNAFAPYDLWTMLGFCIALVVVSPLGYDVVVGIRERRAAKRDEERGRRDSQREVEDLDASETKPFEPV